MSIKQAYFDYLDHIGRSITLRELHEHPGRADAVALRHDVDHDIDLALEMAHHEHARGIRATYFLLHTHAYWNDPRFGIKCAQLQAYGHEVGLHLNVLVEWAQGQCDDVDGRLQQLLATLRDGEIDVVGTSAHGDRVCYELGFINYWIWNELRGADPAIAEDGLSAEGIPVSEKQWQIRYPTDHCIKRPGGGELRLWRSSLRQHGLAYEASRVPCDHYWTDSGGGWKRSGDPLQVDLSKGRHQILMHPEWWRGPKRTYIALSSARSGSKWLANLIDNATPCSGLHQWTLNHVRTTAGFAADEHAADDYAGLIEREDMAVSLIRQAAVFLRGHPGDVFEANTALEPFIEKLREELPEATLIHVHRDGRDVVRSILGRGWYLTPDDRRYRAVPIDRWDALSRFERACWYYRFTQQRIMSATNNRLCFEKMVADPEYLRRSLAELGIVVHPLLAEREFSVRINRHRGKAFPPYARWSAASREAFEQICGPVQGALGYGTESGRAGATLSPAPDHARRRSGTTVLSMKFQKAECGELGTHLVVTKRTHDGVIVRQAQEGQMTPHLLLGSGTWKCVPAGKGTPCDNKHYYVCTIKSSVSPGTRARVFVLFYDAKGAQQRKHHAATLQPERTMTTFSFRAAECDHHFAMAIHLGGQPIESHVTLRSVIVRSLTLAGAYPARIES